MNSRSEKVTDLVRGVCNSVFLLEMETFSLK